MPRRAFTLTELLVVIAILGLLIAIALPAVGIVRRAAAVAETGRRMHEVQTALAAYGSGTGESLEAWLLALRSSVLAGSLGQPAAAIPGVVRWRIDTRSTSITPAPGEAWPAPPLPPWMFTHPWGRTTTDFITDPEGNNPPRRLPRPSEEAGLTAEERGLNDLTTRFSAELLLLAGVLPVEGGDLDQARRLFRSDRRRQASWNDAWGNPLLVGFAWYHPRRNPSDGTGIVNQHQNFGGLHATQQASQTMLRNREDLFIQRANAAYGYARSVYVAVGSVGERLPDAVSAEAVRSEAGDWTGDAGITAQLWLAVMQACNSDGGQELWRSRPGSDLATRPPWTGVRQGRADGSVRQVSAPLEIR